MNKKTQKIAKRLQQIHRKKKLPDDDVLDKLLQIKIEKTEEKIPLLDLLDKYGDEHRIYQGDNPYHYIRRLFEKLAPFQPRSILDLGSGCGRVLLYGALLWEDVDFYGMEMVPNRVKATNKSAKRLGLENVDAFHGDATKKKKKLPTVDCICIMNTFFPYVLPDALRRLKKYARKNPFLLVTVSTGNILIAKQKWLKEIRQDTPPDNEYDFRFFQTKV